jgi:hypothetical protein
MVNKSNVEGGEEKQLGAAPINNTQVINCTYTGGTASHFTHNGKDYSLHPGETYSLPDIDFVQSLIGQKLLKRN